MTLTAGRLELLRHMKEEPYMEWIQSYADAHEWWQRHEWYSRKAPVGWPDLFLMRRERAVALEVKGWNGKATPQQNDVIARLNAVGILARVVWPVDELWVMQVLA